MRRAAHARPQDEQDDGHHEGDAEGDERPHPQGKPLGAAGHVHLRDEQGRVGKCDGVDRGLHGQAIGLVGGAHGDDEPIARGDIGDDGGQLDVDALRLGPECDVDRRDESVGQHEGSRPRLDTQSDEERGLPRDVTGHIEADARGADDARGLGQRLGDEPRALVGRNPSFEERQHAAEGADAGQ